MIITWHFFLLMSVSFRHFKGQYSAKRKPVHALLPLLSHYFYILWLYLTWFRFSSWVFYVHACNDMYIFALSQRRILAYWLILSVVETTISKVYLTLFCFILSYYVTWCPTTKGIAPQCPSSSDAERMTRYLRSLMSGVYAVKTILPNMFTTNLPTSLEGMLLIFGISGHLTPLI